MAKVSKKEFGAYIRKVREGKNISRAELAKRLNVTEDAVAKWENGKRYPDFDMVSDLSEALGISVQDIYDNSEDKENKNVVVPIVISSLAIVGIIGVCALGFIHNGNGRKAASDSIPGATTVAEFIEETTIAQTTSVADFSTENATTISETTVNDTTTAENLNEWKATGVFVWITTDNSKDCFPMIIIDNLGPIKINYMANGDPNPYEGLVNGDVCEVIFEGVIEETYPATGGINDISLVANVIELDSNTFDALLEDTIKSLDEMGYKLSSRPEHQYQSPEPATETTEAEESTAVTPTGYPEGEVQRVCIYHNDKLLYQSNWGNIADCPSMEGATYLGEITEVNNKEWPSKELQAGRLEVGDKVYELNGQIYVVSTEYYYIMS